ncbi:MAG: hypothetical protein AM326_12425 [Candidatus Thorarchaeota archaeon SMTZ-45]|nr:MAG: hypothetical protein AM326_12425 [Candidatus Thorarchaeota archaeon SMTZ-45]
MVTVKQHRRMSKGGREHSVREHYRRLAKLAHDIPFFKSQMRKASNLAEERGFSDLIEKGTEEIMTSKSIPRPYPDEPNSVRISVTDDDIRDLKRDFLDDFARGRTTLLDNELWVWKDEKRKWLDRLGLLPDEFDEEEAEMWID